MGLTDIIVGGGVADFSGNALLIRAADFLEDKVNSINGLPDSLKSGFGALIAAFKDQDTPEATKAAIRALLDEWEAEAASKLQGIVEEYAQKIGITLPDEWTDLARKLSDFSSAPAQVEWPLFDLGGSTDAFRNQEQSLVLSGAASAQLDLGAGVALPDATAKAGPAAAVTASNIVSVGMSGKLSGSMAFTAPVGGTNAGADKSLGIDYFVQGRPADRFGAVVAKTFTNLVSPFDLNAIKAWPDLRAISYTQNNGFKFGASIELKQGFKFFGADVGAALSVAASINRQGKTELVTWAKGDKLYAVINRLDKRTRASTIGLSVGIDLTSLVQQVGGILESVQGEYKDLLAKFDQFTQPGKLIKAKISETWQGVGMLSDQEKSLILSVLGFQGGQSAEDVLASFLEAKILTYKDMLDDDVDTAAKAITAQVFASLGILQTLQPDLENKIEELLEGSLDKVQGALVDQVKNLLNGPQASGFLNALQKAGTNVAGLPDDLDGKIKQTLKPVRDMLQKYYDILGQIVDATAKTNEAKLKLEFARTETETHGDQADLVVVFSAVGAAEIAAFKSLIRGSFDDVHALLRAGSPNVEIEGQLKKFVQKTTESGFRISFLGFDIGSKSIIDVSTELTIDTSVADGCITATSKAQLDKSFDPLFSKEERRLRMTNLMRIAGTAKDQSLNNVFRLWQDDQSMKRKEVVGFLDGIHAEKLLSDALYNGVIADYDNHVETTGNTKPSGEITVGFDIAFGQLKALLRLGAAGELAPLQPQYKTVVARNFAEIALTAKERVSAVRQMRQVWVVEGQPFAKNVDLSDDQATTDALLQVIDAMDDTLYGRFERNLGDGSGVKATNRPLWQARNLNRYHNLIDSFWTMLTIMHDTYFKAASLTAASDSAAAIAYFNNQQTLLAQQYSRWLKVNKGLFSIPDGIRPETIAFLRSVADLITQGGGTAPTMVATISFDA